MEGSVKIRMCGVIPLFPLLDVCSTHVTLNHCNIEDDTRRCFDYKNLLKVLLIESLRLSFRSISSISFVDVEAVHTSVKGTYWCVQPESNKRTEVQSCGFYKS